MPVSAVAVDSHCRHRAQGLGTAHVARATPGDKQHPVQPTSSTSHDSRAALGAYTASRATRALQAALAMLQAPACLHGR